MRWCCFDVTSGAQALSLLLCAHITTGAQALSLLLCAQLYIGLCFVVVDGDGLISKSVHMELPEPKAVPVQWTGF